MAALTRRLRRLGITAVLAALLAMGWVAVHRAMPSWYARFFYPLRYEGLILQESKRYDLDPTLVAAVIKQESDWVPDERSHQGAVGLMQLLPSTASFVSTQPRRPSPSPNNLERPETNIPYGTRYLRYLIDRFPAADEALVAYNAGEQRLIDWKRAAALTGRSFRIPDDVPFRETRDFVAGVRKSQVIYRRTYPGRLGVGGG